MPVAALAHVGALMLWSLWQHVHGQAVLSVAIEGRTGTAELRAPADDVYGFEHAPRTASERSRQEVALTRLRTSGEAILRFAPALACRVTAESVGVSADRGGHAEVRARYAIRCERPPAGVPLAFGVSAAFPGIERVSVQLLSDTAQVGATIVRNRGRVIP